MRVPLIAGNWKMNGTLNETKLLLRGLLEGLSGKQESADLLVIPPFTALETARAVLAQGNGRIALGAQDLHPEPKGAFTGEISAAMLVDLGVTHVLVGHSERRVLFREDNALVRRKLFSALTAGLMPILCIGESLDDRENGKTERVLEDQLRGCLGGLDPDGFARLILAYEPVWAIGTGRNATPDQAQDAHRYIRGWISGTAGEDAAEALRILYGGSVSPANALGILDRDGIDGALVGGASLKSSDFLAIVAAARGGA